MNNIYFPNDGVKREVLLPEAVIQKRIKELGKQISQDYEGRSPLFVGILKGSFLFFSDLAREVDPLILPEFDFMAISTYEGTESTRDPKIEKDIDTNISGRNLVIVEDIVDKGHCIDSVLKIISARHPASVKVCTLLSKPAAREIEVPTDYVGFEIENKWVEGYGLDTDEKFRNLRDIWYRI